MDHGAAGPLAQVGHVFAIGGLTIVVALAAVVLHRALNGRINLSGLVSDVSGGRLSISRLQLLLVTMGGSSSLLLPGVGDGALSRADLAVIALLGASQGTYLGMKGLARLRWIFKTAG